MNQPALNRLLKKVIGSLRELTGLLPMMEKQKIEMDILINEMIRTVWSLAFHDRHYDPKFISLPPHLQKAEGTKEENMTNSS